MNDYEAWRPALIAFHQAESPWASQIVANLMRGDLLTNENRRTIDALILAGERAPVRRAA